MNKKYIMAGLVASAVLLTACQDTNGEIVCLRDGVVVENEQCTGENPTGSSVEIDIDLDRPKPKVGQKIPAGSPVKTLPKYTPPPKAPAVAPAPAKPAPPAPAPKAPAPPAKSGK